MLCTTYFLEANKALAEQSLVSIPSIIIYAVRQQATVLGELSPARSSLQALAFAIRE